MAKTILHTTNVALPEFHALEVTYNVGVKGAAVDIANSEGKCHEFIRDFPNWDLIATELEFVDDEGAALPKPEFPLTMETMNTVFAYPLAAFLNSQLGIQSAVGEYVRESVAPNSKRT